MRDEEDRMRWKLTVYENRDHEEVWGEEYMENEESVVKAGECLEE